VSTLVLPLFGGVERVDGGCWVWGVSVHCWVLRQHPCWVCFWSGAFLDSNCLPRVWGGCVGRLVGVWLVFENCIVDASILFLSVLDTHFVLC
jgi:hypothetical protein